jgi:hypothetical protein
MKIKKLQSKALKIQQRIDELELKPDSDVDEDYETEYSELTYQLDDVYSQIKKEQRGSVPLPTCCKDAQNYPAIYFETVHLESSRYNPKDFARWAVNISDYFSDYKRGAQWLEWNKHTPPPKFCCYCGSSLPEMVKDETIEVCDDSDGNYCGTCDERLSSCHCLPPAAAYKEKKKL